MKTHLLFVGNKYIYNKSLQEYIIRQIEKKVEYIASITFYKESDNELFLYLEKEFNSKIKLIIVTTKQNFSTVGKLICTVTSDNQVFNDNMLIPQKSSVYEDGSYLLEYKETIANVLHIDEMQKVPQILIENDNSTAIIHIFDEDEQSIKAVLNPIAQMYDVKIDLVGIIDGWTKVVVLSKKYGNLSNFIGSAKKLLSNKLIPASNIILYIIEKLHANQKRVSFAESCSGGLLSYYFTKENGASKVLDGSLITYSNELKENWLAVNKGVLEEFGAVSNEVVSQMSDGALNVSYADYAISISGIAGEEGGTKLKPVGTVYIGIRSKTSSGQIHLQLSGDRNYIQQQSVLYAIKLLLLSDKNIFF